MSANELSGSCSTSNHPYSDEQIKFHLANKIVDTINKCLLNKLANSGPIESLSSLSGKNSDGESTFIEPIRDFKRLGTYCTLRPEQRRKYLLKALPTLQKSRILKTLFTTTTTNDICLEGNSITSKNVDDSMSDTNDIYNLERLIVDCCNFSNDNVNNTISLANKCADNNNDLKTIFNDPDKVEDCLRELDVYLEEIDHNYASSCAISSSSINNDNKNSNKINTQMKLTKENENLLESSDNDDSEDDMIEMQSIRLRELSSSDSKLNECDSFSNETDAKHIDLLRRDKIRRTFTIGKRVNKHNNNNSEYNFRSVSIQNFDPNWRRLSMRKTKPILIPQTNDDDDNDDDDEYDENNHEGNSNVHRRQIVNENIVENGIYEQPNHVETIDDELICNVSSSSISAERRNVEIPSFDSEFLDMIMSSSETEFFPATTDHILPVVALEELNIDVDNDRPRQMGRRSEQRSRIVSITAERSAAGNQCIIVNCDDSNRNIITAQQQQQEQLSGGNGHQPTQQFINESRSNASEFSSGCTSRNPSPISLICSSESSSGVSTTIGNTVQSPTHRTMSNERTASSPTNRNTNNARTDVNAKLSIWPNGSSRMFAALSCTLGVFNISRFSIFSILFGANFIVQFIILSILLGIPMFWLHLCLGSSTKRGPISMWRISPIGRGIGIALVLIQSITAVYSSVVLSWLLVYIRDSCVSSRFPWYRWQEVFEFFRGPTDDGIVFMPNTSEPATRLGETVADYFNGVVLERFQLGPGGGASSGSFGGVRFHLVLNIAIIWLIVFVVLCKGLRSHGKIVYLLTTIPLIGLIALCIKLLTLLRLNSIYNIFASTNWDEFFANPRSWISAAQEAFLTWSMFGASLISIFSHSSSFPHDNKTNLRRDAIFVVLITLLALITGAIVGNCCVQILNDRGFYYFPGSYETISSSIFLLPSNKPQSSVFSTSLSKWLPRYSTYLGESCHRSDPATVESGWQVMRLVTELFPATLAVLTHERFSSFWSFLAFFILLLFGIGQLCVCWQPIVASFISYSKSKSTISTTTLLTCLIGCFLSIPLATENGITIIHFLDTVIGGAWFILLLWTVKIFAVFLVRGRPFSGDIIVNDLRFTPTLSAFVALSWNLLLPIALLTLCVIEYKLSHAHEFYRWTQNLPFVAYWPLWARKIAAFLQIGIFQIVPIVAVVQSYRYLSKGPPDILDRFQLLYRPPVGRLSSSRQRRTEQPAETVTNESRLNNQIPSIVTETENLDSLQNSLALDAPPKYTPPPSYTTATGARIAKMLRNSIRRSVRRIIGEPSGNNRRQTAAQITNNMLQNSYNGESPPAYSAISVLNTARPLNNNAINLETPNNLNTRSLRNSNSHRRHTTTTFPSPIKTEKTDHFSLTMPRRPINFAADDNTLEVINSNTLTAHDVARLLRSTAPLQFTVEIPQSNFSANVSDRDRNVTENVNNSEKFDDEQNYSLTRSIEHLVLNEAPIGQSTAAATFVNEIVRENENENDNDEH